IKKKAKIVNINLKIIDAEDYFLKALSCITDAEKKRQTFKKIYKEIFDGAIKDFDAKYIAQGSLATDFIESGAVGNAALIKSHHNVGLGFSCEELHPFRNLFKYEVREIAKAMALPDFISLCNPFPGPGLFLRVLGAPPSKENLDILRWADNEVAGIIAKHNLEKEFSQLIVALHCAPTVGVKGDGRVYKNNVIVRAVFTFDFMTAKGYQFPPEVRQEITSHITKHPEIVRVWFDETNKPPATTEFE
ncbi:MAG: GMP synthase (glutamine-hydrolyzing), partial [bacterium]